jgi:hypothetical protein
MSVPANLPTTAAECTKLAVIALDQAETLVNRDGDKSAALAAVVARIGQGWAATATAMLEAERSVTVELVDLDPVQELKELPGLDTESGEDWSHHHHTSFCRHNWVRPMEPCANACGQRPEGVASSIGKTRYCPAACRVTDPAAPVTPPVATELPDPVVYVADHTCSPDCAHDFRNTTNTCDFCSQPQEDCTPRCPHVCPNPGKRFPGAGA